MKKQKSIMHCFCSYFPTKFNHIEFDRFKIWILALPTAKAITLVLWDSCFIHHCLTNLSGLTPVSTGFDYPVPTCPAVQLINMYPLNQTASAVPY